MKSDTWTCYNTYKGKWECFYFENDISLRTVKKLLSEQRDIQGFPANVDHMIMWSSP